MDTHESFGEEKPFGRLSMSSEVPGLRVWGLRHAPHLQSIQFKAWEAHTPPASHALARPNGFDTAESLEWLLGLNSCFPAVPIGLAAESVSLGVVNLEGQHLLWPNTLRDGPDWSRAPLQAHVQWQPDAQGHWWMADSVPVHDVQGPVLHLVRWLQLDVADLLQSHQDALALLELHKMAMWRVGHDLRASLNTVFGVAQLITLGAQPDQPTLSDWHASVHACRSHFEDILQDALSMPSVAVESDMDTMVSIDLAWNVVDRMLREARLKRQIIWCVRDLSCVVRMPMHVAVEILLNLANNALKNSPEGRVVNISAQRQAGQVVVEIINNLEAGQRFSAPDLSRPVRDIDWRDSAGSGLGLATSAFLARRHGGALHLEFLPPCQCKASLRVPVA